MERKQRENMEGESCCSMVDVSVKVLEGGKWTWKVSWWSVGAGVVVEAVWEARGPELLVIVDVSSALVFVSGRVQG